ncbi:MAG: hypothetical protein ACRC2R_09880 [Xenococcaceae cyanobacterium]
MKNSHIKFDRTVTKYAKSFDGTRAWRVGTSSTGQTVVILSKANLEGKTPSNLKNPSFIEFAKVLKFAYPGTWKIVARSF